MISLALSLLGSTTAALIDLTNAVSIMLEDNKYVRCLLIDFSKAFDSVNHVVLINKLKLLNIPDNILIGRGGRFGRGVSLYHYRSHLFVRFVGTIPTADRAVF